MRPIVALSVILALSPALLTAADTNVVTTLADLHRMSDYHGREKRPFSVRGRVLSTHRTSDETANAFVLDDGTARMMMHRTQREPRLTAGDTISARGKATLGWSPDLYDDILTPELEVAVLEHGPHPDYEPFTIPQLARETHDLRLVCVTGMVVDIFHDDIDRQCVFLQLRDGNELLSVAASTEWPDLKGKSTLMYATVCVKGLFGRNITGSRIFLGPHVSLRSRGDLSVVAPPATDPMEAPLLEPLNTTDPKEIASRNRGAIVGTVLAVRPRGRLVLRAARYRVVNVCLSEGTTPPVCGERIRVVGRPTTDLYRLCLTHAFWTKEPGEPVQEDKPADISLKNIRSDNGVAPSYNPGLHARSVRLSGTIRSVRETADGFHLIELDANGLTVCAEAPADVDPPPVGSQVSATGIWVYDIDNWRPDAILPRINGYALVLRTADDLVVLANPPWWTPRRLLALVISLMALLVATLVWNRILKRLIDRRGRELYRESIAHAKSELRIGERTRLAVELHDALSQTLAGVSFRIDAVEEAAVRDRRDDVMKHLETARLTLGSCREELRNCLWDLRNDALDDTDTTQAVRRTITPHLAGAELSLRFAVPRARISDTTFHAILRIIRELVVNAVRHGHARRLSVAGALDENGLSFSVRDDGCGFDIRSRPGPDQGHFGIQGIEERLDHLGGALEIDSRPGKGTKVTVRIPK